MPKYSIEEILQRLRIGDKIVLKELFQTHYSMLCRTIIRFVKSKDLAEDLAQEVFIKVWEKRATLQINSSIEAYLKRMAVNQAISYLRRNKKFQTEDIDQVSTTGNVHSGETAYLANELQDTISAAIDTLPPRCKLVFQLSRYEELSYKEIALKLDISIKTVENQMGKALRILREKLKNHLGLLLFLLFYGGNGPI